MHAYAPAVVALLVLASVVVLVRYARGPINTTDWVPEATRGQEPWPED